MADGGAYSRDEEQRRARVEVPIALPVCSTAVGQVAGLELVLATLEKPEVYYCLVRAGLVDVGVLALPHLG